MPEPDPIPALLRDAASSLKAAIAVSAAAILSQAAGDLTGNAKAAIAHFDAFERKLDALRTDALDRSISAVAAQTDLAKAAWFEVIGSAEREGIAIFVERVGELGAALNAVMAQAGSAPSPAFLFDQFFLESMHDLGQRDWSDAGGRA